MSGNRRRHDVLLANIRHSDVYSTVIARGKTLVLAAGLGFLKGQWERFRFKVFFVNGASLTEVPQSGRFLVFATVVKVILF